MNQTGGYGINIDGNIVQNEYTANMYIKKNIDNEDLKDVLTWLYYFCAEAEAY